jgi:ferredoxin
MNMDLSEVVISEARRLFDSAGIVSHGGDSIVTLGMATSQEQDLDDFSRDVNNRFFIYGFEIHVKPRLDSLVSALQHQGLTVEILGRYGYPLEGVLNLKQLAVAAGLCHWGKNAMVLHPELGPRFRLMAIKIVGIVLPSTGPGKDNHTENPLCQGCTSCIEACPVSILEPYYLRDSSRCLSNTTGKGPGKVVGCDRCWMVCPVGTPAT